jgi:hypothetical protein
MTLMTLFCRCFLRGAPVRLDTAREDVEMLLRVWGAFYRGPLRLCAAFGDYATPRKEAARNALWWYRERQVEK